MYLCGKCLYYVHSNILSVMHMSYGLYGRGYGRGLGLGLGPNFSPYCRWYPGMPRGWWANPAYAQQVAPQSPPMMNSPSYENMPYEYPSQVAYPPQAPTVPSITPPQFQSAMIPQQPYYAPPMPYGFGGGRGMGMGLGRGMGMQYRWGMGRFGRGPYQY
jgi:hypothetical protein